MKKILNIAMVSFLIIALICASPVIAKHSGGDHGGQGGHGDTSSGFSSSASSSGGHGGHGGHSDIGSAFSSDLAPSARVSTSNDQIKTNNGNGNHQEESTSGKSENALGQDKSTPNPVNPNSPAALTAWAANTLANLPQPVKSERVEGDIYVPEYLKDAPGNSEAQAFRKWLEEIAPDYGITDYHMDGLSGVALVFHYPARNPGNPLLPDLPPNNPHLQILNPPLP